jgi:hypothetical protein
MVPKAGLEPARGYPLPPQDSVSTKFHHFGTFVYRQQKPNYLFAEYCLALNKAIQSLLGLSRFCRR